MDAKKEAPAWRGGELRIQNQCKPMIRRPSPSWQGLNRVT